MLGQSHQNAFGAENACLFAGNLGDRAAEPFHVIEGDVCNDGDKRLDDVGGIKAPAKANFDNGYFDLLLGKVEEGESCHNLKEGGGMGKSALANKLGGRIIDLNIE